MTFNTTTSVPQAIRAANGSQSHSPLKTANSPKSSMSLQIKEGSPLYNSHFSQSPTNPLDTNSGTATRDTILVLFTLTLISVMLFFTLYFWRKHRDRPLATLYKLEEYRYSRLSQNEMEVDSVVFYSDTLSPEQPLTEHVCSEADNVKAATLHVETDSLITIPNCTSQVVPGLKEVKPKATATYDEMSDEDLLQ